MRVLPLLLIMLVSSAASAQIYLPRFDVQGHRGCRGLKPENTIPTFLSALDSGVTTLEMDLAITLDRQIVVSHEPWMAAEICLDPSGKEILPKDERKYNIYKMTYAEVKEWDCGSKINPRFPDQEKMAVSKPLLIDVILAAERHIKNYTRYEVDYSIEIKSDPSGDQKFHPDPKEFSDMVFNLVDQYLPLDRIVIQSFDFRVLKYWHEHYPQVRLAALIENRKSANQNLIDLGFTPAVYSPDFKLLDRETIEALHKLPVSTVPTGDKPEVKQKPVHLRVIPWTVNEEKDMVALKGMGVDGFITDYPNRAAKYKMTLSIIRK